MMWVVPDIQVDSPRIRPVSSPAAAVRWAKESRARERRRWVVRTLAMLLLTSIALVLFIVWERDAVLVRGSLANMEDRVRLLQERFDAFGYLPGGVPVDSHQAGTDPSAAVLSNMYYLSDRERFYADRASGPVIIAFAPVKTSIPQILGPDGRCVIFFEDGRFESRWMSVTKFHRAWQRQHEAMIDFERKLSAHEPEMP